MKHVGVQGIHANNGVRSLNTYRKYALTFTASGDAYFSWVQYGCDWLRHANITVYIDSAAPSLTTQSLAAPFLYKFVRRSCSMEEIRSKGCLPKQGAALSAT